MPKVSMSVEDYLRLLALAENTTRVVDNVVDSGRIAVAEVKTAKRRASAYQRRYKAAFRAAKKRFMTNAGKWKKGGFKSAVRAAHKAAKK